MTKKKYLTYGILILTLSILFIIFIFYTNKNPSVCLDKNCFSVEIADNNEERTKGLMFREMMNIENGMLFIFDETDVYSFWMKNTKIPIDILWINENGSVVFIAKNVQPCEQEPCQVVNPPIPARFVLEINANLSENLGIKIGDVADFKDLGI